MPRYDCRLRVTAWASVMVTADSEDAAAALAEEMIFGDFDIDDISHTECTDAIESADD